MQNHQSGSALLSINGISPYKINEAGMKAHFHVRFIQITFPQPPTSCNLIGFLTKWKPIKYKSIEFCARYFPNTVNVDICDNSMVFKLCFPLWPSRFCFLHYGYSLITDESFYFGALLQWNLDITMLIFSCMSDIFNPSLLRYISFSCFIWSQIAALG